MRNVAAKLLWQPLLEHSCCMLFCVVEQLVGVIREIVLFGVVIVHSSKHHKEGKRHNLLYEYVIDT